MSASHSSHTSSPDSKYRRTPAARPVARSFMRTATDAHVAASTMAGHSLTVHSLEGRSRRVRLPLSGSLTHSLRFHTTRPTYRRVILDALARTIYRWRCRRTSEGYESARSGVRLYAGTNRSQRTSA